ncbi:hypothetical protein GWK47_042304 [Chionoecetes opilio]|uniref:Uncharacterized protein n=1 Tax=Chionoecetes opilio TaxID=41210 RepID=A0A8J4YN68_CHIOP|nr:hypothetical protein GWK47_042304 [Chionoecetes opilio]
MTRNTTKNCDGSVLRVTVCRHNHHCCVRDGRCVVPSLFTAWQLPTSTASAAAADIMAAVYRSAYVSQVGGLERRRRRVVVGGVHGGVGRVGVACLAWGVCGVRAPEGQIRCEVTAVA